MQNLELKHLDQASISQTELTIDALARIAPSCITEVKDSKTGSIKHAIDFHVLRQLLGDNAVEDTPEAYEFTWVGKQEARREAAKSIRKTLRPVPEDSVDWDNTQNIYIEGDNLEALKLLQKSYLGKVKMIYIDPPYNTGNDFVYHDDFKVGQNEYDEKAGNVDEEGYRFIKNTDSNGRFHSDWCSMIYSRLMIARSLLTEDGFIFVSIDENEFTNAKAMCDEVFGENNHYATFIIIRSEGGGLAKNAVIGHDYLLIYSKDNLQVKPLGKPKDIRGTIVEKEGEPYWIETDWFREVFGKYGTCHYEDILKFYDEKKKEEIDNGIKNGDYILIEKKDKHIVGRFRKVADDTSKFYTILKHLNKKGVDDLKAIGMEKYFDYPKPISLLHDITLGATIKSRNNYDIVLDFFSGSATTAHAVMQLNAEDGGNRRFIMVQLPEETSEDSEAYKAGYKNICEIGKERIRRAGKKIKEELLAKQGNGQSAKEQSSNGNEQGGLFDNTESTNSSENTNNSNVGNVASSTLDIGFRVFRIDSGNMKENLEQTPDDIDQTKLDFYLDNVKDDRTELDLLFGCMLNWGVQLSLPMTCETVDGCNIYTVNDGDLVACLTKDQPITENIVRAIAEKSPLRVLFRDGSFASDASKINIFEQFKQHMDWSDDEIIKNVRVL